MNGVLRSMLEATGDSSRFSGDAGTVTNPWAIEDTYDFMNMDSKKSSDKEICFMLKNNIDFNDHEQLKYGWTLSDKMVDVTWCRFDGDGKQIRNLVIKGVNFNTYNTERWRIKNLYNTHFVNLVDMDCSQGGGKWLGVNSTGECRNCSFNIMHFSNTNLWCIIPTKSMGCSYNISYNSTDRISIGESSSDRLKFDRCHINFDNCSSDSYQLLNYVNLTNCCVTGSFTPIKPPSSFAFAYNAEIASSMIAVNVNTEGTIKVESMDYWTAKGINVVDKEIAHIDKASTATVKYLTTAEMKDTSILQGYGFPVVRG